MKGRPQTTRQGPIPNHIASDITTLALITRIAIRDNRQCRGIWSRYGQPYIPHGVPDFTLSQRIRPNLRESQKDDGTAKAPERPQNKSNANNAKPKSAIYSIVAITNEMAPVKTSLDVGRYRFPRDKIIESEIRCRKGKNGKFLSSRTNASDIIFAPINLSKMTLPKQRSIDKATKQPVKHHEYQLYQDHLNELDDQESPFTPGTYNQLSKSIQPSPSSEQHPVQPIKRQSKLKFPVKSPIMRWRDDFSKIRRKLNEELQDILARQTMDRSMVMHDRTLLSKITESVERRAADRLPHKTSVWSEVAHERKAQQKLGLKELDKFTLDNRKRADLYWELQVFVQKTCAEDGIDPVKDQILMATVDAIRGSLEDRTPLDLSFVLAVTSKLEIKTRESPRYQKIFNFLCKHLNISQEAIQEFDEKGISLPPSVHTLVTVN